MIGVPRDIVSSARAAVDTPEVVILDVGHGNCAVLRERDSCVIVDAKSDKLLYQHLVDSGIRHIEHVVLSHADTDHIAGALRILPNEDFTIGTVWLNSDSVKDTAKWRELLTLLQVLRDENRLQVRIGISDSDEWSLSLDRIRINILHPPLKTIGFSTGRVGKHRPEITSNGMSVVLRVFIDGYPVALLPGDLDAAGLRTMAGRNKSINAHVLVYPHHGGRSGSPEEEVFARLLCDVVAPKMVLFSMGRGRHNNPIPTVVEEMGKVLPDVKIGCTQLSPNCHKGAPPMVARTYLLIEPAAGQAGNECCLGTVRIEFVDGEVKVHPPLEEHGQWVRTHVREPICSSLLPLPESGKAM